jgi:hypothetical protein
MATGNRAMPTLRLTNARPQNLDVWGTTPELGDIVSSSPVSLSLARYGPQHRGSQHPTFFNIEIEPSYPILKIEPSHAACFFSREHPTTLSVSVKRQSQN